MTSIMDAPSVVQPFCCVCGSPQGIEQHHVIPRARTQKKAKDRGPTLSLCKLCHAKHHMVHHYEFAYDGEWTYNGKPCHTAYIEGA